MSTPSWISNEPQQAASSANSQASTPTLVPPFVGHNSGTSPSPGVGAGPPSRVPSVGATPNAEADDSVRTKFVSSPGFIVPAPSFSYNVLPTSNNSTVSPQPSPSPSVPKPNPSSTVALLQPPVPGQSTHSRPSFSYTINPQSNFNSGTTVMTTDVDHSHGEQPLRTQTSLAALQPPVTGQSGLPQSYNSGTTALNMPLSSKLAAAAELNSNAPATIVSGSTIPATSSSSESMISSISSMPIQGHFPPIPFNPATLSIGQNVPPHAYPGQIPIPVMLPPPPSIWQRPSFLPYSNSLPGPFPVPGHIIPQPSVPVSFLQPSAQVISNQAANTFVVQSPLPSIDNDNQTNNPLNRSGSIPADDDANNWSSHRTETGVVYYYNAITGVSTYEKPSSFKGEIDRVKVQPTPVSWEKLPGTDWSLVTTNDGKKYYYNSKEKISSWQPPLEVLDSRKKQDNDSSKDNVTSLNPSIKTDREPSITLNAPAISNGGRDAISLKTSIASVSSSALDLVKKKLQDAGPPIISSSVPSPFVPTTSEINQSKEIETITKAQSNDNNKDKVKDVNGNANMSDSTSDSDEEDSGPTEEECIMQFKEMLKERGVAPFSKWEKELPKIIFDPRFKAVPSYTRRSLFEHYVRTRAEEERKEKRAAQKAALEGFKQLLEEASEDIDHTTDYQGFKRKWGTDPRFEALDRKDRVLLLNERVNSLKKAAEEKIKAMKSTALSNFKSMLREREDIDKNSRWFKVKDSLRNDSRYKSISHEDREVFFNEYISELKSAEDEAERAAKSRKGEQDKLKEREREMRKRKEREEQEMERVRMKVRRKEAISSYQALLVETIKDPKASWTESKPRLEKDPQERATNPDLDQSDTKKLFREHVKMLYERCICEFRSLLSECITISAASQVNDDGKTVLNSWSTAKSILKSDPRYSKVSRKDREAIWQRYAEELQRKQNVVNDTKEEHSFTEVKHRVSTDSTKKSPVAWRGHGQR